jgi:hypothetical protein
MLPDDKMKVIDIILDMYPDLKKNKADIVNVVFGKLVTPYKYIFTKIIIDDKEYYIDPDLAIYDKNLNFEGFIKDTKLYMINIINAQIEIDKNNNQINKI